MSDIIHSGYLSKRGHVVSNWKHRFFIIQAGKMSYFKSQDITTSPKGSFNLRGAIVTKLRDDTKSKWFGFVVTIDSGKKYSLRSLDYDEREKWIEKMESSGGQRSLIDEPRTSDLDRECLDCDDCDPYSSGGNAKYRTSETGRKTKPPPPTAPSPSSQKSNDTCTIFPTCGTSNKKDGESDMDAAYRSRREEFQQTLASDEARKADAREREATRRRNAAQKDVFMDSEGSFSSSYSSGGQSKQRKATGRLRRNSPERKQRKNKTDNDSPDRAHSPTPPRSNSAPRGVSPVRGANSSPPSSPAPPSSARKTPLQTSSSKQSALPSGWEKVTPKDGSGSSYYYHKATKISRWEFPDEEAVAAVERSPKQRQGRAETNGVSEKESLRTEAEEVVQVWARRRGLATLLKDLYVIYPLFQPDVGTMCPDFDETASEEIKQKQVKKAYMKAALALHPDKLTSTDPKEIAIAAALFTHLTAKYERYKAK